MRAVVVVGAGVDDAQDLQHRVGEVGVPAAGAEADLAEDLAVAERAREGRRAGEEAVERLVVQVGTSVFQIALIAAASRSRIAVLHGA